MLLGIHVSTAGKIYEAIGRAVKLGCNTMQIFSRIPQQWRRFDLKRQDIEEFCCRRRQTRIQPLFVHASYLINLSSPDATLYKKCIQAYIEDIREAGALGAEYLVTHMGSHKGAGEEKGIKRFTRALDHILNKTKDIPVTILLENTAGSGSNLGYTFKHHQSILSGLKNTKRIGLCIDTAHAYAAGYNIAERSGLKTMLNEIDNLVGLDKIKLIHLNDVKSKLGSRVDRHDHIGKGHIGLAGMKLILNHPSLRNLPFILETPKDSKFADKRNLERVRILRRKVKVKK